MKKKPDRQLVESCTTCPFASDGVIDDVRHWSCHGRYTKEGWPRRLPGPSDRPPRWCPLRGASRLIVLKVRT